MPDYISNEKQLRYMEFVQRENNRRHHRHDEEMRQYELMRAGDPSAVEVSRQIFSSALPGHVSDDPLRNYKYLFVASITLCTRFAIQGGLDEERAYNISDMYILKMDACATVDAVKDMHTEMFAYFTEQMAVLDKQSVFSKPIVQCMDYVYHHLYEPIHVKDLSAAVGLNASYLCTLFKKETGRTVSEYVLAKRLEAAENMLKYSDYTYAQISAYLAFSSQSYFSRVFRECTGFTPKAYRMRHFDIGLLNAKKE